MAQVMLMAWSGRRFQFFGFEKKMEYNSDGDH